MFNGYVLKKYSAFAVTSIFSGVGFLVGLLAMKNVWWGICGMAITSLLAVVIANILLKSPWQNMLEGQGVMVFNLDSTGIVTPFLVGIKQERDGLFLQGKFGEQFVNDPFDRRMTGKLKQPIMIPEGAVFDKETGDLTIRIQAKEFQQKNLILEHYPMLFYNQIIGSITTKEFLSGQEKELMIEHLLSYQRHETRKLSDELHNLVRTIMDMLAPSGEGFMKGKWSWLLIGLLVIGGIILVVMFAPNLIGIFKGSVMPAVQTASQAASQAASSTAVATGQVATAAPLTT